MLLKSRALDGRARLRLLCGQLHNCFQCVDRLRSGFNANSVGQIDRPQHEVECRWAIVGPTRSMGEGMRVDAGFRAVSVVTTVTKPTPIHPVPTCLRLS